MNKINNFRMKNIIGFIMVLCFMVACESNTNKKNVKEFSGHAIVANEVIQVNAYTYVRAEEKGKEIWLAAPSFKAVVGETYYFKGGFEMAGFKSKELNRVFESIYFLQEIHNDPSLIKSAVKKQSDDSYTPVSKSKGNK